MIDDRPVSREDYVLACESNPQLPRYEEDEFDRRFKSLVHGKRSVKVPTAKQEDEFPMKLLRGPKVREALGWLQECSSPLRTLGESTSQGDSIALVQRFYSLGAVSVHAVEIHGDRGEFQNSGRLIIELPQEAARRKQLFQACGEIAEDMGFDPDSDIGQKYIFVMLD
jgi:hypothetical protein